MKGKILFATIAILLLLPLVYADTDIYVGVDSDGGDINGQWDLESDGGDISVLINGVDYEQELNHINTKIYDNGFSSDSIYKLISELFLRWRPVDGQYQWRYSTSDDLGPDQEKIRWVFDTYFVPRREHEYQMTQMQNQINQLQLEIKALELMLGADAYCEARKQVAEEYGIETVKCGNTTVYLGSDISITTVNPDKSFLEDPPTSYISDPYPLYFNFTGFTPLNITVNGTLINLTGSNESLEADPNSCFDNFDCEPFQGMVCVKGEGVAGTCTTWW